MLWEQLLTIECGQDQGDSCELDQDQGKQRVQQDVANLLSVQ